MENITLEDRDLAVLAYLRRGRATVDTLADALGDPTDVLRERLSDLADNDLVRENDPGGYELTASGTRVLATSRPGGTDERIDTPESVERRIEALDLRPDERDAVRGAFAFLRYWEEATRLEIVDGVYSERPAAYPSAEQWWDDLVRDALASLPEVEPPATDGDPWRYVGASASDEPAEDGRTRVGDADATGYGSVKHAVEDLRLGDEEARAVEDAFEFLRDRGEATSAEIRATIHPERSIGYESAKRWWTDCVRDALAELPGVESPDNPDLEGRWRYRGSARDAVLTEGNR